jgi:hypothetical protein
MRLADGGMPLESIFYLEEEAAMANAMDTNRDKDLGFTGQNRPESEDKTAQVAEKARELASAVSDKSKELASAVAQAATGMAKDAASTVAQRASDVAATVGRKAEDATSSMGGGLQSLGQRLREKGPHEGMMGTATSAVANTLENSGHYLQEEGLAGLAEDLSTFVRRYPLQSVLVGIGIGFCLARLTRSKS